MPDGPGIGIKPIAKKEVFQALLGKMEKIDFSPIVAYLQREEKNNWTESKALSELENFKAFLALCGIAKFSVVPTKDVDEVWHCAILHTKFYFDLCYLLYGRYIHHQPSNGTTESRERDQSNFRKTGELFKKMTGRSYAQTKTSCCNHCSSCTNCTAIAGKTHANCCDDDDGFCCATCGAAPNDECGAECGSGGLRAGKCGRCSSCGASVTLKASGCSCSKCCSSCSN